MQSGNTMQSKTLKILLWLISLSVGIAALVFVVASLLAIQPEKEIEQAKAVFLSKYPKTEDSASAVKLKELASQLGLKLIVSAKEKDKINVSDADEKAFKDIQVELAKYIDDQNKRATDEVDVPPEKLRRYLKSKEAVLAAIRTHVLKSEVPRWATDLSWIEIGDTEYPQPSYLSATNLQRLLALDILEKNRLGQTKPMLESLEVSWKLNQSLRNSPILIGQLVSVITARIHAGVMRKLNGLPPEWQQRLLEHDYRKSLLTSLEGQAFLVCTAIRRTPLSEWGLGGIIFLEPAVGTYHRWGAIDTIKVNREIYAQLPRENVCSFDTDSTSQKLAWWNPDRNSLYPSLASMWRKPGRLMLELEMTQKIMQAKELAAKPGKWPQSLPDLESSICAGYKWIYKVSPDGTMSISLSQIPAWFNHTTEVPLTYSAKLK
jgi:hypothetical protein